MINADCICVIITDSQRLCLCSAHLLILAAYCCCFRFLSGTSQRTLRPKCKQWSCPSSPIQTPSSLQCPLPTLTWPPQMLWNWHVRLIQMVGHFVHKHFFSSDLNLIIFPLHRYLLHNMLQLKMLFKILNVQEEHITLNTFQANGPFRLNFQQHPGS